MVSTVAFLLILKSAFVIIVGIVFVDAINRAAAAKKTKQRSWWLHGNRQPWAYAATMAIVTVVEVSGLVLALVQTASITDVEAQHAQANAIFAATTPSLLTGTLSMLGVLFLIVDVCEWPRWLHARKLQEVKRDPLAVYIEMYPTLMRSAFASQVVGALCSLLWFDRCGTDFEPLWSVVLGGALPDAHGAATYVWKSFLPSLVLFALGYDLIFWAVHRAMHKNAYLYAHFHSVHHKYSAPCVLEGAYFDTVDLLLGNLLPMLLCAPLATTSGVTIWLISVTGAASVAAAHSGYNLSPLHNPGIHDRHHEFFDVNYSSFIVLDVVFGTFLNAEAGAQRRDARRVRARTRIQPPAGRGGAGMNSAAPRRSPRLARLRK